jgi:nicotinamidase-related amidase
VTPPASRRPRRGRQAPTGEEAKTMPMLDLTRSMLVVIDVQERFYGALADVDAARLATVVERVVWLAATATALGVPALVTEEDPDRHGPTEAAILQALPREVPRFTKPAFGLVDVPEIFAAVEATGRRQVVLAGLETDVCVAQSAIGLLDRGFRVVVAADAVFSPAAVHEHGLRRMSAAGVELLHAKGIYYEWVRTLAAARAFEAAHPELVDPPGFAL